MDSFTCFLKDLLHFDYGVVGVRAWSNEWFLLLIVVHLNMNFSFNYGDSLNYKDINVLENNQVFLANQVFLLWTHPLFRLDFSSFKHSIFRTPLQAVPVEKRLSASPMAGVLWVAGSRPAWLYWPFLDCGEFPGWKQMALNKPKPKSAQTHRRLPMQRTWKCQNRPTGNGQNH